VLLPGTSADKRLSGLRRRHVRTLSQVTGDNMAPMNGAGVLTRSRALDRGIACRAWHAVLAAVVTASLITQVVLIVHGGADVNTVTTEGSAGLGIRLVRLFSYFTIE